MFILGQKVIAINSSVTNMDMNGMIGEVIGFDTDGRIAVKFDTYDEQRHTCKGLCNYGFGWFFNETQLISVTDNVDCSQFEPADDGDICDISGGKADYKVDGLKFSKQYVGALCKCEECGKWHYLKDLYKYGERKICSSCVSDLGLQICSQCKEVLTPENKVTINRGRSDEFHVCNSCFEQGRNNTFFVCDDCGEVFTLDHCSENDGNIRICDNCVSNWTYCLDCGDLVRRSEENYFGGNYFCERHNPKNVPIQRYGFKPEPTFFGEGNLYMGVELEIDGGYNPESTAKELKNDCIYCKHDGSLGSNGIEIVTHPCTLKYHEEEFNWGRIVQVAHEHGYQSHQIGTCGLHVHVNRNFFGSGDEADARIARIMLFFQEHWGNIVKFSRRRLGDLSHWANKPYTTISKEDTEYIAARKAREEKMNTRRYQAVNLQNDNTVEFRVFRGTLNVNTLIATLQFVDGLCRYVMNHNIEQIYSMPWSDVVKSAEFDRLELTRYLKQRKLKD